MLFLTNELVEKAEKTVLSARETTQLTLLKTGQDCSEPG